jgi:hypothetical protein
MSGIVGSSSLSVVSGSPAPPVRQRLHFLMAMRLDAEHSASDQSQAEEPLLAVSLLLCRNRNISERMLRRPKHFRRNAKRYDPNASDSSSPHASLQPSAIGF